MEPYGIYLILLLIIILIALAIISVLSYILGGSRMRERIREEFGAQDYGNALKFTYRGYTMLATFGSSTKISIPHEKNVKGIAAPKGMKLTPMFLTVKIGKKDDVKKRVDEAIDFLESIPTR